MGDLIRTYFISIVMPILMVLWGAWVNRKIRISEDKQNKEREQALREELKKNEQERAIHDYQAVVARSVRTLLHDEVYRRCEVLLEQGFATPDNKRDIERIYEFYKALGGNGVAKSLYGDVMHLPIALPIIDRYKSVVREED